MYKAKFAWPNGANIAVVFNMSWESWPKTLATAQNNEKPSERVTAHAKYGRGMRWVYEHAHGETGGLQRLLDIWRRHDVPATCYADGLTVQTFPDLARAVAKQGEIVLQGWDHSFLWEMTVAEQADSIDRTNAVFEKELGKKAVGFSSAGGHLTPETFELLAARGFKYCCGLRNADVPFIIRVGDKKLVGMSSYNVSEFRTYMGSDTPRAVIEMWRDYFDALYEEGARGYPHMLAYGTHPFLSYGFRTRPLEELIDYVKRKPKVWIATRGEIADWMLQNYPEHDLAAFFAEAVASDKLYGLSIGLGGEEARKEAYSFRKD